MKLTDTDLEKRYSDFLDECYGTVKVCGYEYEAARALAMLDPIAFRCGMSDWLDSELGQSIWEKDGEYYDSEP